MRQYHCEVFLPSDRPEVEIKPSDMDESFMNLGKAVSLAVCYGANIGGIGTLTGTGPNLIIGNVVKE